MFIPREIDHVRGQKRKCQFFQVVTLNYVCYRINTQVALLLSDTKTEPCLAIFVVSFDILGLDLPIVQINSSRLWHVQT